MNLRTSLKKRDGASACSYSSRPVRWGTWTEKG